MTRQRNYIQENKAAFFDWLIFGISFSLGFVFPSLRDFVTSPAFSYCMLAALLFYTAGAWLKHLPLCYRLNLSGNTPGQIVYALFLMIGHWIIFLTVVLFSESAVRKIAGFPPLTGKDNLGGTTILLSIVIAAFITWLVYRSRKTVEGKSIFSPTRLFRQELVADIFLVISVSILSFAFWEKGAMALLAKKNLTTIGDVWFLFVFLSIAFILFYLPLRYLFLIEDHSSRQTWKRLILIFSLLLIKSLFEVIKF